MFSTSSASRLRGLASWWRPAQATQLTYARLIIPSVGGSNFVNARQLSLTPQRLTFQSRLVATGAVPPVAPDAVEGNEPSQKIIETELRQEAEQSYLAYAMSVIVGRALPDTRDGLKPVHRRILYAMHGLGLEPKKPFRKCARVVGEVLGKFHPHGDTAVYDALVRMAQDFSMRATLVDGHGNFGSLDDDPAAAMRYTECRLKPVAAAALLEDLDSETVEPSVLPARVPNLLINGSSGIAVGIATKIPPHNMREVVQGLKALINNPDISIPELMKYVPAPDFPTGGEIIASDGILEAYTTGRGSVLVRGKVHVEDGSGKKKPLIVITELPFQTNKAALVEQIAKLVDEGKITGISDIRDESDRDGMRVVVELKRGTTPDLTLNQLMKHTTIQSRFACNMIGLVDGLPKTLTLKDFLKIFLDFRCEIVEKRAQFELAKAKKRLHLVDGFLLAMARMDQVVNTIRAAKDGDSAMQELQTTFMLTKEQAQGVMNLTLRRLTSMETKILEDEQAGLNAKIQDLEDLIARKERILQVVMDEADKIAEQHGDDRRTNIVRDEGKFSQTELREVDIIPNSPSIVSYSRKGYIKRMSVDTFTVQGIRGTGKTGARLKEEDSLEDILYVNDHDHLLFFTNEGQAFALNAYEIPESSRTATGTPITQLLRIKPSNMAAILPVSEFSDDIDMVLLSSNGMIKRIALSQFGKINARGVTAMALRNEDNLKFVSLCSSTDSVLLTSSLGKTLHFPIEDLRRLSRTSMGVKTMNTGDGSLVGMCVLPKGMTPEDDSDASIDVGEEEQVCIAEDGPWLFTLTKKGLGKRVPISSFRVAKGRIGRGVIAVKLTGGDSVAAAILVGVSKTGGESGEDILISTMNGMVLRVPMNKCRISSRNARGGTVVKVREGDEVSAVTVIQKQD
ncbi:hypothetical protein KSW81_006757 [Nannochloris sp. 'desiccata']|nr:hypothetical protein KSW81_006757 [Chlorella desiccata (nom. nud.)]